MKVFLTLAFVFAAFVGSSAQNLNDSTAIVQLLEKEASTWRAGDLKGHAECWLIRPYSRILVSTSDGKVIDVPPAMMINPPPNMAGHGGHATVSEVKMGISKKTAWVSHKEESVATDGVVTHSYEVRQLEKVKGSWKLVGQTILLMK